MHLRDFYFKGLFALILSFVMLFGSLTPIWAADNTTNLSYHYKLLYNASQSTDKDDSVENKKVVLDLYVMNDDPACPKLDAGSFGLRFPLRLGGGNVSFKRNETNIGFGPYGKDNSGTGIGDTYHTFSWYTLPGADYTFNTNTEPKGIRMHLGTYTFLIGNKLPSKSSIGLLNWFTVDEAKPDVTPENPKQDPALDPFNQDIWYDTDGDGVFQYQCFYLSKEIDNNYTGKEDADKINLTRTDTRLEWKAPSHWPNAATLLFQDPKKLTTARLYDSDNKLMQTVELGIWKDKDTADIYSAFGVGTPGTGLYYQALDLNLFTAELTIGKAYKLLVTKPGHIPVEIPNLVATSKLLADAQNIPEEEVYLPCGDISPVWKEGMIAGFGDGAIKLGDRSMLLGFLNRSILATDTLKPVIGSDNAEDLKKPTNPAYHADLNGDGIITLKDLSILMSPLNYNQVTSATVTAN